MWTPGGRLLAKPPAGGSPGTSTRRADPRRRSLSGPGLAQWRVTWEAGPDMPPTHLLAVTERAPEGPAGTGPLVVLVHGSLDRADSFSRVVRRLDDLPTVVYDRRGYQGSRGALPLTVTLDGQVDDLLAVIDGRPSVVVGHSYGGDIALAAALRGGTPSPIRSVAAYEPPMPWLGSWSRRPGAPTTAEDVSPAVAAERFFRRMVGDAAWDRLPERTKAERRADGPALAAELQAIRLTEAPFDVTALTVPATFGRGGGPRPATATRWDGSSNTRRGPSWSRSPVPTTAPT